ncbi:MAG: OsmC family protein [Bacteroidota bacterium]
MDATLRLDRNMRIIGTTPSGLETIFDTHPGVGGEDTAPTPMEVMLQAMAACSFMDIVSIIRKKRKHLGGLKIYVHGDRAEKHPKVFTEVQLTYELTSEDAEMKDLVRAIELSQSTYCGASAIFQRSGCTVTWKAVLLRP